MTVANRGKIISEAEFRRLWNDRSITLAQIGDMLGITENAVSFRAKSRGLEPRGNGKLHRATISGAREGEFVDMYTGGVMSKDIAEYFRVAETTVTKTAARLGLPARGKAWCHEGIPLAKWREDRLARAMAADAARARVAMVEAGMQSRNRPQSWAAE